MAARRRSLRLLRSLSAQGARGGALRGLAARASAATCASASAAGAAAGAGAGAELVRDFVGRALAAPQEGYFARRGPAAGAAGRGSDAPVGRLQHPVAFGELPTRDAYEALVEREYRSLGAGWLTPAELFRPWYGYAVGEYLCHLWESPEAGFQGHPMRIYEVGGGNGTAARDVLDYVRAAAPALYDGLRLTSVEVSARLAEAQRVAVADGGEDHAARHDVVLADACDADAAWGARSEEACAVVALEVLDNLPHDKVVRKGAEWQQAMVVTEGEERREVSRVLSDEPIARCLALREAARNGSWGRMRLEGLLRGEQSAWLPTGCLQLLRALHARRPNHALIAADFSRLPPAGGVVGEGAPVVASKRDGINTDHSTYMVAPGSADIFFPTDFHMLKKLWLETALEDSLREERAAMGEGYERAKVRMTLAAPRSVVMAQQRFMATFADAARCRLGDGYNPLLEDFENTAFFLSHGLPPKLKSN